MAIVGSPVTEASDHGPTPPALIGQTLVVAAANHLQAFAVIDLHLVPGDDSLEDGTGIGRNARRQALASRIVELERRVASGRTAGALPTDLAAREAEIASLRGEQADLAGPAPAPRGSWFAYDVREVRTSAGTSPRVTARIAAYYRQVNEHNRVALADHRPPPAPPDGNGYVGVELCGACHESALAQWQTTWHARAYQTLMATDTQFNLDCVGCHVTGYEQPGGSSVVAVAGLEGMQCENCHGPGALHSASPGAPGLIRLTPERTLCASRCHQPPHVLSTWTVDAAWPKTIGPGHGLPEASDPPDPGQNP